MEGRWGSFDSLGWIWDDKSGFEGRVGYMEVCGATLNSVGQLDSVTRQLIH